MKPRKFITEKAIKMSSRVVVLLLSVVLYGSYATPIHHQQTHQVELGKNVILLCESNDNDHLFSFWHAETNDNIIIGPSNKFNKQKFKYEVLSGNLTIHVSALDDFLCNFLTFSL